MNQPQHWNTCDATLKTYIQTFISLLKQHTGENLKGVYLHGSLAMGSFYAPKSDIDLLAVVDRPLSPEEAATLNLAIAKYAETRPLSGSIEFSMIRSEVARSAPSKPTYLLHYSAAWHERILKGEVSYVDNRIDTDLSAHLTVIKQRGICLFGEAIGTSIGAGNWEDFVSAVLDDFNWILSENHICESPYYSILNICRTLQLLIGKEKRCLSKDEGGQWGLCHLPAQYRCLIDKALDVYHDSTVPKNETEQKTGGVPWDNAALLQFKEYAAKEIHRLGRT